MIRRRRPAVAGKHRFRSLPNCHITRHSSYPCTNRLRLRIPKLSVGFQTKRSFTCIITLRCRGVNWFVKYFSNRELRSHRRFHGFTFPRAGLIFKNVSDDSKPSQTLFHNVKRGEPRIKGKTPSNLCGRYVFEACSQWADCCPRHGL